MIKENEYKISELVITCKCGMIHTARAEYGVKICGCGQIICRYGDKFHIVDTLKINCMKCLDTGIVEVNKNKSGEIFIDYFSCSCKAGQGYKLMNRLNEKFDIVGEQQCLRSYAEKFGFDDKLWAQQQFENNSVQTEYLKSKGRI